MVVAVLMDRGSAAAAGGCRAFGGCAGADAGGGWRAMTLQVGQEREGEGEGEGEGWRARSPCR